MMEYVAVILGRFVSSATLARLGIGEQYKQDIKARMDARTAFFSRAKSILESLDEYIESVKKHASAHPSERNALKKDSEAAFKKFCDLINKAEIERDDTIPEQKIFFDKVCRFRDCWKERRPRLLTPEILKARFPDTEKSGFLGKTRTPHPLKPAEPTGVGNWLLGKEQDAIVEEWVNSVKPERDVLSNCVSKLNPGRKR